MPNSHSKQINCVHGDRKKKARTKGNERSQRDEKTREKECSSISIITFREQHIHISFIFRLLHCVVFADIATRSTRRNEHQTSVSAPVSGV